MEKIRNYIKNGKGLGFLFLLASAVVMTIFVVFILKQTYTELRPQMMLVADEILPITVREGKIVQPQDVYKRVDIRLGNDENQAEVFPVVLDTKGENAELPKAKMGLFIMKDVIYWIMENEVKRFSLQDGEMTKPALEKTVDAILGVFSLIVAVVLIVMLFVFSLIETVILAVFGSLFLKACKIDNKFSFDALMRLSAVMVAIISLVGLILSLFGLPIMWIYQFLAALLCVGLFLYNEKSV